REGWWLLVGGPFAVWGRLNHWLPFRAARAVAMRSIESAADPAMRTVVAGAAFVVATYLAQTAVVAAIWGRLWALLYLISLPLDHWQATTPAAVAGGIAAAVPMKSAQKCGYESGFVAVADHPDVDASGSATMSPGDLLNFRESIAVV